MKKLSLIFALLMVASSVLVACGSEPKPVDTTNETTAAITETETNAESTRQPHKVPAELDFDGAEFRIVYPYWQGYVNAFFADVLTGEPMNDALYNRTRDVETELGIDIVEEEQSDFGTLGAAVRKAISTDDDTYHLVLMHCITDVSSFASSGYLYNLDDLPHVDFSAEWWNQTQMDALRLGKNTYYGVSDYMIPCPYAIFFNEEIIKNYDLDNPYQLVYDKKWTIDKMIEMAKAVTGDLSGDGNIGDDDMRGLSYNDESCFISFMTGADQFMMAKNDEDRYEIAMDIDKTMSIIEKFAAMANTNGVIVTDKSKSVSDGNILFQLNSMAQATTYRESDYNIGILPYPLYDEEQENYISLDWGGLMCVPTTIKNPEMVGATLELLSYKSAEAVIPMYYDVLLDGKIARNDDTIAMIDILFDTIAYEPGGNYFGFDSGTKTYFYALPDTAIVSKSIDFASKEAKIAKAASATLASFYKKLDNVEG